MDVQLNLVRRSRPFYVLAVFAIVSAIVLLAVSFAADDGITVQPGTVADETASEGTFFLFEEEDPGDGEAPIAGHDGNIGCMELCQTVGFQDLNGKSSMTLTNLIISNPGGQCMDLRGASDIVIMNVTIQDCATQTELTGAYDNPIIPADGARNITFENVKIENIARRDSSDNRNNLFHLRNVDGFIFTNSEITDLHSDISVGGGQDNFGNRAFLIADNSKNITIERSSFFNPGRNFVQVVFNGAQPGLIVRQNRVEGRGPNDSDFEDMINTYASGGTSESPMLIEENYFIYGGPSHSGTAAILGDSGRGRPLGNHIHAIKNVAVNTGHVGFGIYGGEGHRLEDNIVYSNIEPPDVNAVGIFVFREDTQFGADACRNNTIVGNRVWFQNSSKGGTNNQYIEQGRLMNNVACENSTIADNVWGDASLSFESVWPF